MFKQISYIKLGEKKGNKRLWIEGKRLKDCGFDKGQPYIIILQHKKMILKPQVLGDRSVSGRATKTGAISPIIEFCSKSFTNFINESFGKQVQKLKVTISHDQIEISMHQWDMNQIQRETHFFNNISQTKISTATLCAGGGISTAALHEGLECSGLKSSCNFIIDIEGKYLQSAINNVVSPETKIFEGALEEIDENLEYVDILNISLPCTGHSKSGKAKNKIKSAEEHNSATAIIGCLNIIDNVNPTIIINENVPEFKNSASYYLFIKFLRQRGYSIEERILDQDNAGTLEKRRRHFIFAISNTVYKNFSFSYLQKQPKKYSLIEEIIEFVPEDDDSWKEYSYLDKKERRDKEAGKGFSRQLLTGAETSCGTIGKGYFKARSTEPFLSSATKKGFSRLFLPSEHARLKGIPTNLIKNLSNTVAHEILGQSVLYPIFVSIGKLIGNNIIKN